MIFVDVGAHEGQTLEEAVRYDFECLYAFEPMPAQFARLSERFGGMASVELINAGLSGENGTKAVYGSNGDLEASVFPDKADVDPSAVTYCEFIAASDFLGDKDRVYLKLNCEGAEIQILDDLIDNDLISRVESVLVDFDCQHVPGMEDEEARIRRKLDGAGFYGLLTSADVVPKGRERRAEGTYRYTRRDEIMCWLKSQGVAER